MVPAPGPSIALPPQTQSTLQNSTLPVASPATPSSALEPTAVPKESTKPSVSPTSTPSLSPSDSSAPTTSVTPHLAPIAPPPTNGPISASPNDAPTSPSVAPPITSAPAGLPPVQTPAIGSPSPQPPSDSPSPAQLASSPSASSPSPAVSPPNQAPVPSPTAPALSPTASVPPVLLPPLRGSPPPPSPSTSSPPLLNSPPPPSSPTLSSPSPPPPSSSPTLSSPSPPPPSPFPPPFLPSPSPPPPSSPISPGDAPPPPIPSSPPPSSPASPPPPPPSNGTNSSTGSSSGSSSGIVIGAAAGGVIALLVLLGLVIWCCCRKSRKGSPLLGGIAEGGTPLKGSAARLDPYRPSPKGKPGAMRAPNGAFFANGAINSPRDGSKGSIPRGAGSVKSSDSMLGSGSNTQSWFSYEELERATGGFSPDNKLGEGGFGKVYMGTLPDGTLVAVKALTQGGGQGEREFQAEVDIISRVHHRHLVTLLGYCIANDARLLVYEYVPNGTLEYHLHGNPQPMPWASRRKVAVGSAKGLAYLHEDCQPRIIHRDIKSSNILLDKHFEAEVADFGLAKLQNDTYTHVSTRVMGTFGYLAPEYAMSGKLTDKSDVFSYGVVLLELITGRRPVDTNQPPGQESLVEWARPLLASDQISTLIDTRLKGNYDESEMQCMVSAAALCVRHSASRRPKMSQVVRMLDGAREMEAMSQTSNKPGVSQQYDLPFGGPEEFNSAEYSRDMRRYYMEAGISGATLASQDGRREPSTIMPYSGSSTSSIGPPLATAVDSGDYTAGTRGTSYSGGTGPNSSGEALKPPLGSSLGVAAPPRPRWSGSQASEVGGSSANTTEEYNSMYSAEANGLPMRKSDKMVEGR